MVFFYPILLAIFAFEDVCSAGAFEPVPREDVTIIVTATKTTFVCPCNQSPLVAANSTQPTLHNFGSSSSATPASPFSETFAITSSISTSTTTTVIATNQTISDTSPAIVSTTGELSSSALVNIINSNVSSTADSTVKGVPTSFSQHITGTSSLEGSTSLSSSQSASETSTSSLSSMNNSGFPFTNVSATFPNSTTTQTTGSKTGVKFSDPTFQAVYDSIMNITSFNENGQLVMPPLPERPSITLQTDYPISDPAESDRVAADLQAKGLQSGDEILAAMDTALVQAANSSYAITPDMLIEDSAPDGFEEVQLQQRSTIDESHTDNTATQATSKRDEFEDEDDSAVEKAVDIGFDLLESLGDAGCEPCEAIAGLKSIWDLFDNLANPDLIGSNKGTYQLGMGDSKSKTIWSGGAGHVECNPCQISISDFTVEATIVYSTKKKKILTAKVSTSMNTFYSAMFRVVTNYPTGGNYRLVGESASIPALSVPGLFTLYPKFQAAIGMKFDATFPVDTLTGMQWRTQKSTVDLDLKSGQFSNIGGWQPTFTPAYPAFTVAYKYSMSPWVTSAVSFSLDIYGRHYDDIVTLTQQTSHAYDTKVLGQSDGNCPAGSMQLTAALDTKNNAVVRDASVNLFSQKYPFGKRCFQLPTPKPSNCPPGFTHKQIIDYGGRKYQILCQRTYQTSYDTTGLNADDLSLTNALKGQLKTKGDTNSDEDMLQCISYCAGLKWTFKVSGQNKCRMVEWTNTATPRCIATTEQANIGIQKQVFHKTNAIAVVVG